MKIQADCRIESSTEPLITKTETYARCPHCGNDSGHALTQIETEEGFGPVYCHRCGGGFSGFYDRNGQLEIWAEARHRRPTYVLLRIDPQPQPIYIVIRSSRLIDDAAVVASPAAKPSLREDATAKEQCMSADEYSVGVTQLK